MALPATIRRFALNLADSDRGVYEALDLRVAQHPSESERFLVTRLLARALEHGEGVEFGKGLSSEDEPALAQRNLRGELLAWIEVGSPSAERIHRASKACARVVIYAWRAAPLAEAYGEAKVHRLEHLTLVALEAETLDALASTLARNNAWEVAVNAGIAYVGVGERTFEFPLARVGLMAQ